MKRNRPAQDRYPGWDDNHRDMDLWDWLVASLSALCMALGVYIYLTYPDAWYYTVTIGATVAKIVFWLFIAGIAFVAIYNLIKFITINNQNRTRTHTQEESK